MISTLWVILRHVVWRLLCAGPNALCTLLCLIEPSVDGDIQNFALRAHCVHGIPKVSNNLGLATGMGLKWSGCSVRIWLWLRLPHSCHRHRYRDGGGGGRVMHQTLTVPAGQPPPAALVEVFFVGTGCLFRWPARAFAPTAAE